MHGPTWIFWANLTAFSLQDLAFVPRLEQVSVVAAANSTIGVYGTLARMVPNSSLASTTTIHARFSDSRPAVLSRRMGPTGGVAVLCAFHPSLSYFHQATPPPRRPDGALSSA